MILIAGTLSIDPAKADDFWAAAVTMMATSRAEDGCRTYTFSRDAEDPATVHLFEQWETQEALTGHGASAHMKAFGEAVGSCFTGRNLSTYFDARQEPRP